MGRRNFDHWMENIDDEDFTLLGSRIARAAERHRKRQVADECRDADWNHRPRKRQRPEPHRERYSW